MTDYLPRLLAALLFLALASGLTPAHATSVALNAPSVPGNAPSVADPDSVAGEISPTAFLQAHDAAAQSLLATTDGDYLSTEFREVMRVHIFSAFDFHELSRLSLGSHWLEHSAEERSEFVRLSTRLVEEQNLDSFISYYRRGDTRYTDETVDESTASITATVPLEKGDQVEITYHLHQLGGEWRVFDLAVDGASTADGNRRRYARYIEKNSYEALIQQMQKQLDGLIKRRTSGAD